MAFTFTSLNITEVLKIEPKIFPDERGLFWENYKFSEFQLNGVSTRFVQDNISVSKKGVLRGLHFQKEPKAQAKLVYVVRGKIWDVAADIREGSESYGQWVAQELSEENQLMLYIPEGFAHGFLALEDNTKVCYKTGDEYDPATESGIRYNDPTLNITWPLKDLIISAKDKELPLIGNSRA